MTNNETLLQQIKEMESKLEEMKLELNKKEKWEPSGGDYVVSLRGDVLNPTNKNLLVYWKAMGYTFNTLEKAEKAKKYYRFIHRLYKLAEELNEGWEPDWGNLSQKKYFIEYYPDSGSFAIDWYYNVNTLLPTFKDAETAKRVIEILNGEDKYWEE